MSYKYNHSKYVRKYKPKWESEAWALGWLMKDEVGNDAAFCKVCKTSLRAHHKDLFRHTKTKQHEGNMKRLQPLQHRQEILSNMGILKIENEDKERDLKLAVFIAVHSSIRSVDHLCEVLVSLGKSSKFENLQLHRTKCSSLIKNVIAPCFLKELLADVGEMRYSLIIDESTDISIMKYLCLCIRYFSIKNKMIKTHFLGIIHVESTTADSLCKYIIDYLLEIGLNLSNLIGLGTDGANNLCGKHHSVFSLLKERLPHLQLVRCICHSLDNASSKASEELPSNIDFLCKEIYNWFSVSAQRRSDYRKIFELLNNNDKPFHQFVHMSSTRWLARYNVVNTLLEHWFELKTHFDLVVKSEKCYKARLLNEMLHDDTNLLYLKIVKPILYEINLINLTFQKNEVDIGKAYDDLCNTILTLGRKIIRPVFIKQGINEIAQCLDNPLAYVTPDNADFGIEYYQAVAMTKIDIEHQNMVKIRAYQFIKKLLFELVQRLPNNLQLFRNLKMFSPSVCLSQVRPNFIDLHFINQFVKNNHALLEIQWQKLLNVDWLVVYGNLGIQNTYHFWSQVYSFQDAGGTFIFQEIATFALTVLSLPSSNAVVERVFSVMNAIKTKARNRLQFKMLESVLRIRFNFFVNNVCCKNFQVSNDMLCKFNSHVMYPTNSSNVLSESEDLETLEICSEVEMDTP